ncbi:hypothetical protein [Kocuria sp. HSID16901]|uniref:hypothetical protein n=1 Tax=Kocuria sp. HSID16901 TaxID=2419505 RepID=UPI000F888BDB|nr:hypothetical protein [Kocuria sp. HSID16901]RUQ21773.1 hypothetical protein D8M21_05630 [Kocuria sp. HSID16901]
MNHQSPDAHHPDLADFPVRDPTTRRVRSGLSKALLILASLAIAVALGTIVGPAAGSDVTLVSWIIEIPLIYVLTRIFRGANESDAPRPWWQLTARSTASLMLGGVPGFWVVIYLLFVPNLPMVDKLLGLVCLAPCVMYLHSWYRLIRRGR